MILPSLPQIIPDNKLESISFMLYSLLCPEVIVSMLHIKTSYNHTDVLYIILQCSQCIILGCPLSTRHCSLLNLGWVVRTQECQIFGLNFTFNILTSWPMFAIETKSDSYFQHFSTNISENKMALQLRNVTIIFLKIFRCPVNFRIS